MVAWDGGVWRLLFKYWSLPSVYYLKTGGIRQYDV